MVLVEVVEWRKEESIMIMTADEPQAHKSRT